MLKRVTAVCMVAMPALATSSSHVPGRSARNPIINVWTSKRRRKLGDVMVLSENR